jgi:hypothetical protein
MLVCTVYSKCWLALCTANVGWHCVLLLLVGTVYCCWLALCTATVGWHCVLLMLVGTVYCYVCMCLTPVNVFLVNSGLLFD